MNYQQIEGAEEIDEFNFVQAKKKIKKPRRIISQPKVTQPIPVQSADTVGPDVAKPQQTILDIILDNLPYSELYERSLMHRENINIVLSAFKSQIIITVSTDGYIKMWRKVFRLVEFIKHFRAHRGIVTCVTLTDGHDKMASVSPADRTIKIFDIWNQDLLDMIKLPFQPYGCEFVDTADVQQQLLLISDGNSGDIYVTESGKILRMVKLHNQPVKQMRYLSNFQFMLTIDTSGRMEVWDPITQDFPKQEYAKPEFKINYSSKVGTDLYELMQNKLQCYGLCISNKQKLIVLYVSDKKFRVFNVQTGKIIIILDESIEAITSRQNDQVTYPLLHIEQQDFERRLLIEKDIDKQPEQLKQITMCFDETDQILIYPSFIGIKFIYIKTGELVKLLGKMESSQRFMRVALYQGPSMKNTQNEQSHSSLNRKETDPSLYISAHKSNKFYVFSRRIPEDLADKPWAVARDILNEPLNLNQQSLSIMSDNKNKTLSGCQAIIQTTFGEIYINLFPNETPKTVENFIQHSKNGYFDGLIFHRVQQGFMIQTGCPKGNGTGGESIWGGEFQDEFHPEQRHDKPFTVSMANAGPNTNASQFFITVCPTPWLDDKHTILGRVYKGMNIVVQISEVETDDFDKPLNDIKIIAIKIL
ncbi:unnamed protein product [Paramecium pentaurelia]|uniref:peptidylprolyl isomerase n=1 Tax=Paramecium pentaurelia TaxID=43138 RepID=A0A8S1VH20_9CILI|nr:unnamed protein product [Paramecium pentaurelia]